jgi:CRISPR/Cas system CSM-associated protein Csm3 (group 7 of RAMP superfamily)
MKTKYIAQITIEADTPLKVGSNSSDFLQDSPIQKDWNGLPMIFGTSIAGVLRKHYRDVYENDDLFGFQRMDEKKEKDLSEGSKVILSNALLLDEEKTVNENLLLEKSEFLKIFDNLPIREHTKIDHRGVTGSSKEYSKFDEEVVYKGTQFKFSIEVLADKEAFKNLLELLQSPSFRLGGGTTKGFGKFRVLSIATVILDSIDDLVIYSSSLNSDLSKLGSDGFSLLEFGVEASDSEQKTIKAKNHTIYTLKIKPDDFFIFGAGFGDADADQTPVYEKVVDYKNQRLSDKQILIPASSVKGALSHRTAFYYNKKMMKEEVKYEPKIGEENDAVVALFGHKKEMSDDVELGQKGKLLISDCFKEEKQESTKVFDHVSIDRFTGGAIDGALFQEKTIAQRDNWDIEILLENDVKQEFKDAFEKALKDVCKGMLALGGATTKGHGVFIGTLLRDGEVLDV